MYCDLDDLRKALPEDIIRDLTDDERLDKINTGRVDEAIEEADGEIDTYIGGRYSVPLATVPPIIRKCSCNITIYSLYSRKVEELPPTRVSNYKNAQRILEQIRDGKMDLDIDKKPESDSFASGALVTGHFGEKTNA